TVPRQRDSWTPEQTAEMTQHGDGSGIRIQGYLVRAIKEKGASANCRFKNYVDWHLSLGSSPDSARRDAVIAVVGPRIRVSHPNWTFDRFQELAAAKAPIRVSGWLYFDQAHQGHQFSATLWEIRPAVKIEFLKDQTWLDLDDHDTKP